MPYIEDFIKDRQTLPKHEGMELNMEYTIKDVITKHGNRSMVVKQLAGTVFIGSKPECVEYIRQQRVKQALKQAELELGIIRRGLNPDFTR
jgi:hypothetical protein